MQKRKASAELALISSQGGRATGNPETSASASASLTAGHTEETPHNVLAFGQWFFFCQHCKHGGHAACIDDWFEGENKNRKKSDGRDVCGVNGCLCHCRSLK